MVADFNEATKKAAELFDEARKADIHLEAAKRIKFPWERDEVVGAERTRKAETFKRLFYEKVEKVGDGTFREMADLDGMSVEELKAKVQELLAQKEEDARTIADLKGQLGRN